MYILRNDSLDRFGTTLEKIFKKEIFSMMENNGLVNIRLRYSAVLVCVGFKKKINVWNRV